MIELIDPETGVILHLPADDDMLRRFAEAVSRVLHTPAGPRKEAMRRHVYAQKSRLFQRREELAALLDRQLTWLVDHEDDPRHAERDAVYRDNLNKHQAVYEALEASWEAL